MSNWILLTKTFCFVCQLIKEELGLKFKDFFSVWSEWASHFNGGESAIHKMENNHYQRCEGGNQSKNIH